MRLALITGLLLAMPVLPTFATPFATAAEAQVETHAMPQTQLYIRTVPPDAKVQINGKPRGSAPLLLTLPPEVGKVLLEVELNGFAPGKQEIIIEGGRITRVELKLRESKDEVGPPATPAVPASKAEQSQADSAKLGRLDLRMVPTVHASKTHIHQSEIDKYQEKLRDEGPFVGRDRGDEFCWYQLRCEKTHDHITAEHEGRQFILLSNRQAEVMLAIGWKAGTWKLHGVMTTVDNRGLPSVTVEMDDAGGQRMSDLTGRFILSQLAMLVDDQVVSMPKIQGTIGRRIQITGRFTYPEVERLVRTLRSSVVPPRASEDVPHRERHFVRLVVGKNKMTFEGQETSWEEVPKLLNAVPNREHTVLEIAIDSDEMSVRERDRAQGKASLMGHRHGFEYPSYIGVHRLGSKGPASQKVLGMGKEAARFRPEAKKVIDRLTRQRKMIEVAAEIAAISQALQMYELDIRSNPSTEQGLEALLSLPSGLPNESRWRGPYMKDFIPLDPWGFPYKYTSSGKHHPDGFDLWSVGPDGETGTDDDVGNWSSRAEQPEPTRERFR